MAGLSNQSFTELDVWNCARKLKIRIWELIKTFPVDEKLRLTDQLIRSSRSICSVIAEGHAKFTYKDKINYCVIGRGSLSETWNRMIDAFDSGYITKNQLTSFKIDIDENAKLLNGYINFLRTIAANEKVKKVL